MEREIVKEYTNGELTVVWKPKKCIHAAVCVNTLPEVYDPNAKPWINPENASTDALKAQIDKCPSGALSYYMNAEGPKEEGSSAASNTKAEVIANGPLMVYGTVEVSDANGNMEVKERATAFCRCGASNNKPYCDGAHNDVKFVG